MHPSNYPTAWEHPPTRRAWAKQTTLGIFAFIGWFLTPWCLLAFLVVFLSPGFIPLFIIPMVYSAYLARKQPLLILIDFRTRRLLRAYPWHLGNPPFSLSPHSDSSSTKPWLEFPNPARPEELIPMHFHMLDRTGWWSRRMGPRAKPELKAQLAQIWFAGDPRFLGIIAATAPESDSDNLTPKRMLFLAHYDEKKKFTSLDVNPWLATPEDLDRARQVVKWRQRG